MTTSASNDAPHKARTSSNAETRIVAIGLVTVALYIVNYYLQRCIFHGDAPSADGSRGSTLAWQMAAYATVTVALFGGYLAVLAMAKRGELTRGRALMWAMLVPCM